jgi:putative ABC transport system permease protein
MEVSPAGRKFDTTAVDLAYYRRVLETAAPTPGVHRVALVSQLPLGGSVDGYGIRIESQPEVPDQEKPSAARYAVMGPYFTAMGIRLVKGRLFTDADREQSEPVVIVNDVMARLEWPNRDPIGDRIQLGGKETPWRTIVGVVGAVRHAGLDQPVERQIYLPETQWMFADGMTLVARTTRPPDEVAPALAGVVRAIDPDPTITRVASMEAVIARSTASRRFVLSLFEAFAAVALLLAAAGIYGVTASGVTERFREFGIRSALGASTGTLLGQVLLEAIRLGIAGVAVGSLAAVALSRLGRGLLYDVSPSDPVIYGGAALVLGAIAVASAYAPARRASRLDPTVTLRGE